MNEIGLLTVHCSTNFGASLQAYALLSILKRFGNTKIINYRFQNFLDDWDNHKTQLSLRKVVKVFFFRKQTIGRYRCFKEFEEEYLSPQTMLINSDNFVDELSHFNIVVVGSDQVWNPEHVCFDKFFWFEGVKAKKVSYSASLGKEKFTINEAKFLKYWCSQFDLLSVREDKNAKWLEKEIDKSVDNCIDPVFLLDVNQWRNVEIKVDKLPDRYLLVYMIGNNDVYKEIIKQQKGEMKVVCIQDAFSRRCGDINLYNLGPREFLYLIDNAELIITNSFHGTAFSYIFKKKFIVLKSKRNLRLENLLDKFSEVGNQIQLGDGIKMIDNRMGEDRYKYIVESEINRAEVFFERMSNLYGD